jgi:hypothetical protein
VGGVQCIANITTELHLSIAFVRAAEKAIQLFGLIGNSMGIQAYSSGETTKRRGGPGDTMKRIYRFGDTIQLIIKCLWGDAENTLSALSR